MTLSEDELLSYLALSQVEGVGPVIARNLIAYCGGILPLFGASVKKIAQAPEVGIKLAEKIAGGISLDKAKKELEYCRNHNIQILTFMDNRYPEYLKNIYQAPIILFAKGLVSELNHKTAVGVIGTRKPSSYGKKIVKEISNTLSEHGLNVVSGLAYGIDHDAHQTTLDSKGFTTAVMASGFKYIYPASHKSLTDKILESGVLITEYFSDTPASKYAFPQRNRILAGICKAVVIIESPIKGGSLITAQLAFDQNREVYAVPGSWEQKNSEGTNALIRDNIAKLLTHPREILEDLGISGVTTGKIDNHPTTKATPIHELDENERLIIQTLHNAPLVIDQIEELTRIPVGQLLSILINLEFKGWIEALPGKKYKRLL